LENLFVGHSTLPKGTTHHLLQILVGAVLHFSWLFFISILWHFFNFVPFF